DLAAFEAPDGHEDGHLARARRRRRLHAVEDAEDDRNLRHAAVRAVVPPGVGSCEPITAVASQPAYPHAGHAEPARPTVRNGFEYTVPHARQLTASPAARRVWSEASVGGSRPVMATHLDGSRRSRNLAVCLPAPQAGRSAPRAR